MIRRRAGLASITLVLALSASLAACSTTRPDSAGSGSSGADLPSPGINAESVRVGYQVADVAALRKRIGFTGVDYGTVETSRKQIAAVAAYVNANGGMGGRTFVPVIREVSFSDANVAADASCRAFTQDDSVFAVIVGGDFSNALRPCYKDARTVMFDQTAISHDQAELEQYSPYLWIPNQPEMGGFVKAQVESLKARGWFEGSKGVAVVVPDSTINRALGENVIVPGIKEMGIGNVPLYAIDATNIGTLGTTISNALAGVRSTKVDRVFVAGGGRIMGIMVADIAAEGLPVKYAVSTADLPQFLVDNDGFIVDGVREGMAGLGYSRANDLRLSADPWPDPARPAEGKCKEIVDSAGAAPPQNYRENYVPAMALCDVALTMKAALDKVPNPTEVTPNKFRDAMWSLGTSVQMAIPETTEWGPGRYAAASQARPLVWRPDCVLQTRTAPGCFEYDGEPVQLSVGAK
jgi:ABC-type branched-subunit amino acid transport system substrate-binding protein